MTQPKITIVTVAPTPSKSSANVVGVLNGTKGVTLATSSFDSAFLQELNLDQLGVSTEVGDISKTSGPNGSLVALVGLGTKPSRDEYREIGGSLARELGLSEQLVIDLPINSEAEVLALYEGLLLGSYQFNKYKASAKERKLSKILILTSLKISKDALVEIEILTSAVNLTRDLVNHPANDVYPEVIAKQAKASIKGLPVKIKVWEEKDLIRDGLGGIHAVGKGSVRPPRLVKLEYSPKGAKKSLALVGKGITFDTGGLSLKPAEAMVGMKYDMTGAATVMHALITIASLELPVRATAWLCLAENMPSGGATRPNDVIRIRNGKTVEVLNTDAEGRLVLADGLSMASEEKPDYIVDVATLTGAASIALGHRYSGLMGDDIAVKKVQNAAEVSGELVWHMPLPEELRPLLNSDIADIANVKIGNRAGGMLVAGIFLREFVGSEDGHKPLWAHLDIAGTANNDGAGYGHTPKGATGVILRTLVQLARDIAK
ncbi:MAG: leucyl aminopeptidase [Actinomycetota bacterium]